MLETPFFPAEVPRSLQLPETSVWANLDISARRYPDKAAFICYGNTLTYAQLKDHADRIAGFLQQRCGVAKGDRVLLFAQNSFQFVIGYYGDPARRRGGGADQPDEPHAEVRRYVEDCGAKTAIVAQELWPQAEPLAADGTLAHAIVAAYSDYLREPTDLKVPDAFKLPRQPIAGSNVILWSNAIAQNLEPGPALLGDPMTCASCRTRRARRASRKAACIRIAP
jgi:fatty-acyl-CoA synthase